eukprot:gene24998-31401_t
MSALWMKKAWFYPYMESLTSLRLASADVTQDKAYVGLVWTLENSSFMPDAVVGLRHAKTTAGADVSGYDVSARFKLGGTLTFDSVRAVYLDGKRTSQWQAGLGYSAKHQSAFGTVGTSAEYLKLGLDYLVKPAKFDAFVELNTLEKPAEEEVKASGQTAPLCRKQIDETLSGNLCRCTGYRPIIDAAHRMGELPPVSFDREALVAALQDLQRDTMFSYTHDGQSFHAPRTLAELAELRAAKPNATILAGSTDVGLWVTKQMRNLGDVIYVRQVKELHLMGMVDGMLEIGAAVSLDDAYRSVGDLYKNASLHELWQRFASQPIRSTGTLGGSVANGSPIGDSAPWMIVLGAEIVLNGSQGRRSMLLQDFYLDYMKKDWQPGEFVEAVRIPLPKANQQFRTYKLAKRYDQDISAVAAAYCISLEDGIARNARAALPGVELVNAYGPTEAVITATAWRAGVDGCGAAAYAPLGLPLGARTAYVLDAELNFLPRGQ